jgi:hypothetical protein
MFKIKAFSITLLFLISSMISACILQGPIGVQGLTGSRDLISTVDFPGGNNITAVAHRPGTDQFLIVGEETASIYDNSSGDFNEYAGPESSGIIYEEAAWRPQGDFALMVGKKTNESETEGVLAKIRQDAGNWKISILSTSITKRLTSVAWAPDGTYAVLVGSAKLRDYKVVDPYTTKYLFTKYDNSNGDLKDISVGEGPSGLSDVVFNPEGSAFTAGTGGYMRTYEGGSLTPQYDSAIADTDFFSVTWTDKVDEGYIVGWLEGTQNGRLIGTDMDDQELIWEGTGRMNDCAWVPGTDFTLIVGEGGRIWEYSVMDGLNVIPDPETTKALFDIAWNDEGDTALIIGSDNTIVKYMKTFPPPFNYPPEVIINSPVEGKTYGFTDLIMFDASGTTDEDGDILSFEWASDVDGLLGTEDLFNSADITSGDHMITLSVDDGHGNIVKEFINITIEAPSDPPTADAGTDIIGYRTVSITLRGTANGTHDIVEYKWDYEGTNEWDVTDDGRGTHKFQKTGVYTSRFMVTDDRGAKATDSIMVTIFPRPGEVEYNVSDTVVGPGDTIRIRINDSGAERMDTEYSIRGGDWVASDQEYGKDGNITAVIAIPEKGAKEGQYDIRWRYYDDNDAPSDWYEGKGVFTVNDPTPPVQDDPLAGLWLYIIIAIVVAICVAIGIGAYVYKSRKGAQPQTKIEEVFLIYKDGRLLFHDTRRLEPDMDKDVMSGMLVAVQQFVNDVMSGKTPGMMNQINYGEYTILFERGYNLFIGVFVTGVAVALLNTKMKAAISELETIYSAQLAEWDGDKSTMPAIRDVLRKHITLQT